MISHLRTHITGLTHALSEMETFEKRLRQGHVAGNLITDPWHHYFDVKHKIKIVLKGLQYQSDNVYAKVWCPEDVRGHQQDRDICTDTVFTDEECIAILEHAFEDCTDDDWERIAQAIEFAAGEKENIS